MAGTEKSLRGQVFDKIRSDILNGKYKRGEELVESSIGKELGISRTPVREAIRQLELEGLVQLVPNKGAFVTGISEKDVTPELLDAMEETVVLSEYHAKKEHYEQVCEMDSKFHKLLYKASGSRILEHTLTDFHQYVQRVRMASIMKKRRMEKSNDEHDAILTAIREHDEEKAELVATRHISNTVENLKNYDLDSVLSKGE